MKEKLAKCLNDAADLIEREGWSRGQLREYAAVPCVDKFTGGTWINRPLIGRCMWGAICDACPETARGEEGALLALLLFPARQDLFAFNDVQPSTQRAVTDRLRFGAQRALQPALRP